MQHADFRAFWRVTFGEAAPLGWDLRQRFPTRWVRFHTLPGTKRYATTDLERAAISSRQRQLATSVLGANVCWLVIPLYERPDTPTRMHPEFPGLPFVTDGTEFRVPDDDVSFWTSVHRMPFDPHASLLALSRIADDALRALWVTEQSGDVFAPYDGGIDVIASTPKRRDALRATFSSWLPSHPDGL